MATTTFEENVEYAPFNSINKDRVINADHLARWLSSVNSDGVSRKFNELEVKPLNGMNVTLETGVGFVDGRHVYVKSPITIEIEAANSSSTRIDTIGFRLDVANRKALPYYKTGELGSGVAPAVLNNEEYIEIPLYDINVRQGATSILESDLIDKRVYVVSSATYFKEYNQVYNTTATISELAITVPFNAETDVVKVLVNGITLLDTQYSIENNVITFNSAIYSGNEIQVNVWHFQDGSGSMDSMQKVLTELTNVKKTTKYYYHCTGTNDNIALSDLAQNFLAGTGDYAGVNTNAQMEIVICGDCGVSTYYSGDGSQSRPYTYFAFGRAAESTRTIYFNFSNCSRISINCPTTSGTYSTVFSGADINVKNVALNVVSGYNVDIFNGTNIHCEDSEFWMTTTNDCCVGRCCGLFKNIRASITSTSGNAFCFYGNGNLTRVIGGTYWAWTAGTDKEAVPFYVAAYQTENVLHVTMANLPQTTRSGYTQTQPVKINSGYATFMMNTMWMAATQDNGSLYDATKCIASGNAIVNKN